MKADQKAKTIWVDPHTDKEYRIIDVMEDFWYSVRAEDCENADGDPANSADARAIRRALDNRLN